MLFYNAMVQRIRFLPNETLEKIKFSMIVPKIAYGLLVWGHVQRICYRRLNASIESS